MRDPFARQIDHNSDWRSGNDIGGVSLNIDIEILNGTLTSTTAWYFWDWRPSNDRDFLSLNALALSQASSDHEQLSQEFRWAGNSSERVDGVIGVIKPEYLQHYELGVKPSPLATPGITQRCWAIRKGMGLQCATRFERARSRRYQRAISRSK